MTKVFYKGEKINVNDLSFSWEDNYGRYCSGDLTEYVASLFSQPYM